MIADDVDRGDVNELGHRLQARKRREIGSSAWSLRARASWRQLLAWSSPTRERDATRGPAVPQRATQACRSPP